MIALTFPLIDVNFTITTKIVFGFCLLFFFTTPCFIWFVLKSVNRFHWIPATSIDKVMEWDWNVSVKCASSTQSIVSLCMYEWWWCLVNTFWMGNYYKRKTNTQNMIATLYFFSVKGIKLIIFPLNSNHNHIFWMDFFIELLNSIRPKFSCCFRLVCWLWYVSFKLCSFIRSFLFFFSQSRDLSATLWPTNNNQLASTVSVGFLIWNCGTLSKKPHTYTPP